ncbi:MAG TPA: hypothetical protein VI754_17580 [Bacteriovoracaceae bacterium]|nr:hypothetical protein [Bacteriovoracaceae bacterium]
MNYLLGSYIIAMFMLIFISSWRLAFITLAVQFFISATILFSFEGIETISSQVQFVDLVLVRSLAAPLGTIWLLKKFNFKAEFDVIPANLVSWTLAISIIVVGYWCGQVIYPQRFQQAGFFGTATASILLGIYILANQRSIVGQIIGILIFEAGIILLEAFSKHQEAFFIQIGFAVVFLWTITLFWKFLAEFASIKELHGSDY